MKPSSWKKLGLLFVSLVLSLGFAELCAGYLYPYFQPWTVPPELGDRNGCGEMVAFDQHTGWW